MGWVQVNATGGGLKTLDDSNLTAYSQVCVSMWFIQNQVSPDGGYLKVFFKDYDFGLYFDFFNSGGLYLDSGGVTQALNRKIYGNDVPELGVLYHYFMIFDNDGASGQKVNLYSNGDLLTPSSTTSNSVTAGTKFNNTQIVVGAGYDGGGPISGTFGEWGILCGGVPTDDEIRRMALGESPQSVRPDLYWDGDDAINSVNTGIIRTDRQRWQVYGSPSYCPLPFEPMPRLIGRRTGATSPPPPPPATPLPVFVHHYRQQKVS